MKWRFLFSDQFNNPLAFNSFEFQYIKLIFSPCIKIFTWLPCLESDSFPNIGNSGLFWQREAEPLVAQATLPHWLSARNPLGSMINHIYEKTAIRYKTEQPPGSLLSPSLKVRKITLSWLLSALCFIQHKQSLTPCFSEACSLGRGVVDFCWPQWQPCVLIHLSVIRPSDSCLSLPLILKLIQVFRGCSWQV